ncbi:MAG: ATP-binding protein [Candidatus Margulisiibacteriota bacterium]|jgi:hypothetical protein
MSSVIREEVVAIQYLMKNFPCVAIIGARQVGKTTLLKQLLPNAPFFDLEREKDFERITHDPEFFLSNQPSPIIIDEAQLCPKLFNALRVKIDQNRSTPGQFLISGSSSPELLNAISESLAGRIAIVELGSFQFREAFQTPISLFYQLIKEKKYDELISLKSQISKPQLFENMLSGSYPEPFLKNNDLQFLMLWQENYFNTYINRDIRRLFPTLQIETFKRFIKMMAFSSGQIINYSNFARSLDVSSPTIKSYFHIAAGTFLWRILPSYENSKLKRIVKMPKGHLRDTGLICNLLNIQSIEDLISHPQFGYIWESFIIEQIFKAFSSQLIKVNAAYYRTHNQTEIDLLLEIGSELIPIEIKSGVLIKSVYLQKITNFIKENNCPIGIVINNAEEICWLSKSIIQIPASYL